MLTEMQLFHMTAMPIDKLRRLERRKPSLKCLQSELEQEPYSLARHVHTLKEKVLSSKFRERWGSSQV